MLLSNVIPLNITNLIEKDGNGSVLVIRDLFGSQGITVTEYHDTVADFADFTGNTDIEYVTINGMAAVSYCNPQMDTNTVAFVTATDIYEFQFYPASDEGFAQLESFMTASIRTDAE